MVQLLLCEKGVEGPIFSYFVVPDETEIVLFVESGGTVVATVIVSTEPGTCYFFSQLGVEQSKYNYCQVRELSHLPSSHPHPPPVGAPAQAATLSWSTRINRILRVETKYHT